MTNMDPYRIQFANGYIEVEERKSPNGTKEAKCTLYTTYSLSFLFNEVMACATHYNYTHTKMLMRDGVPYFIAWVSPSQEEQQ